MSEYQTDIYTHFEQIEEALAKKNKSKLGKKNTTYSSYTRQACNFVFPPLSQGMTGETRPRPSTFKLSQKDIEKLDTNGNKIDKKTENYHNKKNYLDLTQKFITDFETFLSDKIVEDERNKYTIVDDINSFVNEYDSDYFKFHKNKKNKSKLYNALWNSSAKFVCIIFNILNSPGPVLFYSNYVMMEGMELFKLYLKYFDMTSFKNINTGKDGFRYTEYHGGLERAERKLNLENFNVMDNKYGKIIKIIMISSAGAEGISLNNVRQVHLCEPYWQEVRMIQMIGRAVRQCSHKYLLKSERHVDIFRYKSVRKSEKWTTDQKIEDIARSKEGLIQSFLDAIKEVAIDCELNKSENELEQNYKCFQFDEPSLFADQIGPAFIKDEVDDYMINNGSNNINSETVRIKVIKILAVKQLTKNDNPDEIKYSNKKVYWYYPKTGVIYDEDLHYAIGKIAYDIDNFPKKLDKDTYIIDKLLPIPMIEE